LFQACFCKWQLVKKNSWHSILNCMECILMDCCVKI
jgi:hypothetical protein